VCRQDTSFSINAKKKPKKDLVVLEVRGLDRLNEDQADVDKARIEIKIRKQ